MAATVSLHEKLATARAQLERSGIAPAEAAVDVDLFARTILGWDRARLLTESRGPAPELLEPRLSEWLTRRAEREPSAYIVGVREFWGLEFHVSASVLIPRPETELIVEEALRIIANGNLAEPVQLKPDTTTERLEPDATTTSEEQVGHVLRIADIGTGSGCIAVALAREIPRSRVTATDVSADALAVAAGNAARHGVANRITFVPTSYLDGVDGEFDLVAANPPYVRDGDKPALARDVRHEPDVALFGGSNGLRHIAGVLDAASVSLRDGGWLLMEFGFGQEDEVRRLVEERGALRLDRVREDLQGIARTAVIQRHA